MKRDERPLLRMAFFALTFLVGLGLAAYTGAPGIAGAALAGIPLLVFFRALFSRSS